jgi:hypothetical protein
MKNNGQSKSPDIPTFHSPLNPDNNIIITFWLCYWSLNSETNIFPSGESNHCFVVVGHHEKQYSKHYGEKLIDNIQTTTTQLPVLECFKD